MIHSFVIENKDINNATKNIFIQLKIKFHEYDKFWLHATRMEYLSLKFFHLV